MASKILIKLTLRIEYRKSYAKFAVFRFYNNRDLRVQTDRLGSIEIVG